MAPRGFPPCAPCNPEKICTPATSHTHTTKDFIQHSFWTKTVKNICADLLPPWSFAFFVCSKSRGFPNLFSENKQTTLPVTCTRSMIWGGGDEWGPISLYIEPSFFVCGEVWSEPNGRIFFDFLLGFLPRLSICPLCIGAHGQLRGQREESRNRNCPRGRGCSPDPRCEATQGGDPGPCKGGQDCPHPTGVQVEEDLFFLQQPKQVAIDSVKLF